jgi:hypothetical protein
MLAAIYYGAMYGAPPAILLNIGKGLGAHLLGRLPMAQRAGRVALGVAAIGSFIAGTFRIALTLFAPVLADQAAPLGPPVPRPHDAGLHRRGAVGAPLEGIAMALVATSSPWSDSDPLPPSRASPSAPRTSTAVWI